MVTIMKDFISEEEEKEILSHIRPTKSKITEGRNTIRRYGSNKPYKASLQSIKIPAQYQMVCDRIATNSLAELPDSVTVNEYLSTQAIDWHIDSLASGPVILVLSLLAPAEMGLRNTKTNENEIHLLEPRSLLILGEEHRYDWEHCIYPVPSHRFSVVFRKGTNV